LCKIFAKIYVSTLYRYHFLEELSCNYCAFSEYKVFLMMKFAV